MASDDSTEVIAIRKIIMKDDETSKRDEKLYDLYQDGLFFSYSVAIYSSF